MRLCLCVGGKVVSARARACARARVPLLIQNTSVAILSSAASLAQPHFSTLSRKRQDFRGGKIMEHKMCVLILHSAFILNISHSKKIQRDIVINIKTSSRKVPVILVGF